MSGVFVVWVFEAIRLKTTTTPHCGLASNVRYGLLAVNLGPKIVDCVNTRDNSRAPAVGVPLGPVLVHVQTHGVGTDGWRKKKRAHS